MHRVEFEEPHQTMPLVQLGNHIHDDGQDRECLVNNYSVNSFINSNNELTVTRCFNDKRYSTMLFRPAERNRVDIVVTQGEYHDAGKDFLHLDNFSSQDLRRDNSRKAKCLLVSVFILLFLMLGILIICLFRANRHGGPDYEVQGMPVTGSVLSTLFVNNYTATSLNYTTTSYGNFSNNFTNYS